MGEIELSDDSGFELFTDDAPPEQSKNADFGDNVELF
jgi:hypothetical protein